MKNTICFDRIQLVIISKEVSELNGFTNKQ